MAGHNHPLMAMLAQDVLSHQRCNLPPFAHAGPIPWHTKRILHLGKTLLLHLPDMTASLLLWKNSGHNRCRPPCTGSARQFAVFPRSCCRQGDGHHTKESQHAGHSAGRSRGGRMRDAPLAPVPPTGRLCSAQGDGCNYLHRAVFAGSPQQRSAPTLSVADLAPLHQLKGERVLLTQQDLLWQR